MKQTTLAVSILLALGTSACSSDGNSSGTLSTSSSDTTSSSAALSAAQTQIADLKAQINTLTSNQNALQSQLDSANQTIAELQSQLDTAKASNSQSASTITALEAERDAANSKLNDLQAQVTAYQNQITDLQTQLTAAQNSGSQNSEQIAQLQADLSAAQTKNNELQAALTQAATDKENAVNEAVTAANAAAESEKQAAVESAVAAANAAAESEKQAAVESAVAAANATAETEKQAAVESAVAAANATAESEKQAAVESAVTAANATAESEKQAAVESAVAAANATAETEKQAAVESAVAAANATAETEKQAAVESAVAAANATAESEKQAAVESAVAEANKQSEDLINKLKPTLVTGTVKHDNQAVAEQYVGDTGSLKAKTEFAQKIEDTADTTSSLVSNQCVQDVCNRFNNAKYQTKTGDMMLNFNKSYSGVGVLREEAYTQTAYDNSEYKSANYVDKPINSFVWYAKDPLVSADPSKLALDATYTGKAYFTPQYGQTVKSVDFTLIAKDQKVSGSLGSTGGNIPELATLNETTVAVNSDGVVGFNGTATFNQYAISTSKKRTDTVDGVYEGVFAGSNAEEVVGSFNSVTDDKSLYVQGAFLGTRPATAEETAAAEAAAQAAAEKAAAEQAAAEQLAAEKAEYIKRTVTSTFADDSTSQTAKYATDETARATLLAEVKKGTTEAPANCGNSKTSLCYKDTATGTLIASHATSYAGYAVIRETYGVENKPSNSFVALVETPTTDKTAVVDATYTGQVSYSSGNKPAVVTNTDLTMTVSGDTLSGKATKTSGSGVVSDVITFNEGKISVLGGNVVFDGTTTFHSSSFGNNGDISGTYTGAFAGANAEEMVGTFESANTETATSVQGAFTASK